MLPVRVDVQEWYPVYALTDNEATPITMLPDDIAIQFVNASKAWYDAQDAVREYLTATHRAEQREKRRRERGQRRPKRRARPA